jgi:hypothetical protein
VVSAGDALLRTDTDIHPPIGYVFTPYGDVPLARMNVSATVEPAPSEQAPPPSVPPPPQPESLPGFTGVGPASTRLSLRSGAIPVTLRCPDGTAGGCAGRTTLTTRRGVRLGCARFSIAAGRGERVRISASRAGRRLLHRRRLVRADQTITTRDATGRSTTTVTAVTIRRARGDAA